MAETMKKNLYALVTVRYIEGKAEADKAALAGGRLYPIARHDERCSKGADHAHMMYDGVSFCRSCKKYLGGVEIKK